ncbi:TPA: toxin Cry1Ac domain D-VI-related protein [Listeria monocytogenes]
MNRKKLGIILVSVCFILLIGFVGISVYSSHAKAEEEKKQEQIEKKAALEAEKALEENTTNIVNEMFANADKTLLSDTYSIEDVSSAEDNLKKIKDKKVKSDLIDDVDKAKKLYSSVEAATKQVQGLFKDSKENALATGITRAKIDEVSKMVKEKTPQKKAQTDLEKKVKKAYDLISKKEKAEKEKQVASETKNNASTSNNGTTNSGKEAKSSAGNGTSGSTKSSSNNSNGSNGSTSSGSSNSASASAGSGGSGSSSNSSSSNSSSSGSNSNTNQPTVAKMRLASRTNQIITVVASGSSAQVKFWEKSGSTWKQVFATSGRVGSQGVGSADEYHSRTPRGAYSLGFAFGTSNPGTSLSFRQITNKSYWISNVNDSQYNTWQERNSSNKADERMASYPTQYRYGVVINYNTARTKGAGSGFFLHCSNGAATAGCVAIPTSNMATVLQKLHSGAYIVNVNSESELLNY